MTWSHTKLVITQATEQGWGGGGGVEYSPLESRLGRRPPFWKRTRFGLKTATIAYLKERLTVDKGAPYSRGALIFFVPASQKGMYSPANLYTTYKKTAKFVRFWSYATNFIFHFICQRKGQSHASQVGLWHQQAVFPYHFNGFQILEL